MMTLPFKGLARIHVPVPILHLSNLYARREKRNIHSNRGKPHLGSMRDTIRMGFCAV